jgi:hypothetical protein
MSGAGANSNSHDPFTRRDAAGSAGSDRDATGSETARDGKTPAEIAAYLRDMKIRTLFLRSRTEHFAALDEIAMMLDTGDPDVIAVGRWLETARRTRGAQGR